MGDALPPVQPLPVPKHTKLAPGVSLLEPLSRKGSGPGLIVLVHENDKTKYDGLDIIEGVPAPLMKWAEESYTVVELREEAFSEGADPLALAISALEKCEKCEPKEKIGLVSYDPSLWKKAFPLIPSQPKIVGAVLYEDASNITESPTFPIATLQHLSGKADLSLSRTPSLLQHLYPETQSHLFATPFNPNFIYSSESVSHTRNLTFLKPLMGGPYFDLEVLWDEHTYWEFQKRSVEHTMATMVQEPYVNHVPTITGGIGREALTAFYRDHFIFANPADTEMELISRTVGIDRVIDEFIFKMTHDRIVDWFLPGVPPTGKYLQVPFTAVVNIRGDRLYHEHIAWDQITALIQCGLMPEYLPYKHGVEYYIPGDGAGTAEKMRNKTSVSSNRLIGMKTREV